MTRSKKINIHHLETDVNPAVFLRAEELFDNGSVKKVIRVESQLWESTILDVSAYETEVLLTRKGLLKGHSCSCGLNQFKDPCAHVVTSLLHIRKNQATPIQKKVVKVKRPKNLTVPHILQEASKEELADFILFYSRKNIKFAQELKISFAEYIYTADDQDKYNNLLDQIFKTHLSHHNKISNASARYFLQIGKLLLEKIDTLMAIENYKETLHILFPLIRKSYVILKKNNPNNEYLTEFIIEVHKMLQEFINVVSSPEIIQGIYKEIIELSDYSFYDALDPANNIFHIPIQDSKFNIYHEGIIKGLLHHIDVHSSDKTKALQALINCYIALDQFDQIAPIINLYPDNISLIVYLCKKIKGATPEQIIQVLDQSKDSDWPSSLLLLKLQLLIGAYLAIGQNEKALSLSMQGYSRLKNPSILNSYKPKKKPKIKEIESALVGCTFSQDKKQAIHLYFGLQLLNGNRLHRFLEKHVDLDQFMQIDKGLILSKSLDIEGLIKIKVSQYLSEHFGEQSKRYLYSILNKTDAYQIVDLRSELIAHIHEHFPGRISLKDMVY